jgi:hypothetical protein
MKTLLISVLLLSVGLAYAQTDSLTDQSFNKIYDQSCALVTTGMWNSATGNQPLGMHWRRVAPEFDISPEGKMTYMLAQKQSKTGFGLAMAGIGTLLSGTVFIISGLRNGLLGNKSFDTQLGVGMGLYVGSLAFSLPSAAYNIKSYNNFEKALWLRNRDAMALSLPMAAQPQFKQIYEQEAIYLKQSGFLRPLGYVKNNQIHRFGFLGNAAQTEFQGSVQGLDSYQKYQRSQVGGAAVSALGFAVMLSSGYFGNRSNKSNGQIVYLGGLTTVMIGSGILGSSYNHLRRAIYFRNKDVVRQRLMFQ